MAAVRFEELGLSADILRVLKEHGFRHATEVQAKAIPQLCSKTDVVVGSATGSGKTLAFVIPIVRFLENARLQLHKVAAIIVSPTRELASQIFQVVEMFLKTMPHVGAMLLVGGTDVSVDTRCANVLVGTPGRLSDIMDRCSHLDFRGLEFLILDEADRLLEMGFQCQVTEIIERLPKLRTTGLFSATQSQEVGAGLRHPCTIDIRTSSSKVPTTLSVKYLVCNSDEKSSQLVHFLLENSSKKTIVYFITCASVDYWGTVLPKLEILRGLSVTVLHGKLKQRMREKSLNKFTSMRSGVLFCTDVAARGLDIPGVDWIVQYDPPQNPNTFVHRVGRTARMGRSGDSIVFLLPKEDAYSEFLRIRSIPTEEIHKPDVPSIISKLREVAAKDRDVMEKGIRAFVSLFRAYKEHHCNFIFQWKELELGKLAMGFGLLQLPSMPELRRGTFNSKYFTPFGVDTATIPYRSKTREQQRMKQLGTAETKTKSQRAKTAKPNPTRRRSAKKRLLQEDEAINDDYRLIKKLKRESRRGRAESDDC